MTKAAQLTTLSVAASGSLEAYTHAVSSIQMLSAEEERALAERLQQHGDLEAARKLILCRIYVLSCILPAVILVTVYQSAI